VGAGRCTAVGIVTEGVDVHATLGIGIMASDIPGNRGRRRLGGLLEGNRAGDFGVTTDTTDWKDWVSGKDT
jgi:hypothetical protein